jgi:diguanylate cyclase (GGDEF)-like protein
MRERSAAALLRAAAAHDRAAAERARHLAGIDELTGVSLRSIGLPEITRAIERAHREGTTLVLAFLDVNNLKSINDTEGHLAGDAVLRQVAATMRSKLRAYDVLVRYGGDEFVYAVPHATVESAQRRLNEVIATLEASGTAQPISYGLAELEPGDDLERLLRRADDMLIEGRRASPHRGGAKDAA